MIVNIKITNDYQVYNCSLKNFQECSEVNFCKYVYIWSQISYIILFSRIYNTFFENKN